MKAMRLILCSVALASLLLLAGSAPARAVPTPSPANSTVDPCFLLEPGGTMSFTVVVRDFSNTPISGVFVAIDVCACPELVLCPSGGGLKQRTMGSCHIEGTTDAAGTRVFNIKGGGGCGGTAVKVYADGILIAQVRAASPDQNGDLEVNAADDAVLATKLGGTDLTGDLNCDGFVTAVDQAVLALYVNHTCLDPTSNRRSTWGELKIRYR